MIGSIKSYSSALLLLATKDGADKAGATASDAIVGIVNGQSNLTNATQLLTFRSASMADSAPSSSDKAAKGKEDTAAEPEYAPNLDHRHEAGGISYDECGERRTAKTEMHYAGASYSVAGIKSRSEWSAANYGSGDALVRAGSRWASPSYASKVVEATTFKSAEADAWNDAVQGAQDNILDFISGVLEANHKFHVLDQIDLQSSNNVGHDLRVNNMIRGENMMAIAELEDYHGSAFLRQGAPEGVMTGNAETGYKLNAFQLQDKDGKILAELRANDHLVTYNRDGSIKEDFNRADVGYLVAKFQPSCGTSAKYLALAANVYSEDQLDFY